MRQPARTRPLIIATAVNGAEYSPRKYPALPVTAEEAVNDAVKAYEQGARYGHFHAREPRSGDQFVDRTWFDEVRRGMANQAPGMAISFASSRKGLVANQIQSSVAAAQLISPELALDRLVELELLRAIGMDAGPDLMTIFTALETRLNSRDDEDSRAAIGSYEGTATRGYTDPAVISAYYQRVRELYLARGIVPEYEVTTMGALWTIEMLVRRHWVPERAHFIFLFGFSARLPIARSIFDLCMAWVRYLRSEHQVRPAITVGAVIQPHVAATAPRRLNEPPQPGKHDYLELLKWALADDTVDAVRVGLEDTPSHFGQDAHNADLVALVRSECENAGVNVTLDPTRVQEAFGIRR